GERLRHRLGKAAERPSELEGRRCPVAGPERLPANGVVAGIVIEERSVLALALQVKPHQALQTRRAKAAVLPARSAVEAIEGQLELPDRVGIERVAHLAPRDVAGDDGRERRLLVYAPALAGERRKNGGGAHAKCSLATARARGC